jgi:SIR2-like domain
VRFLADGPSIPDELLVARDEGRVIFFCGAGVSRARAGLADFFGLAQRVVETLGVISDSPAKRLIQAAREIDSTTGISGLISADRVFGLLEREFLVKDIQAAVAESLKSGPDADLSAHRIMLDLGRGPDGKVRLVTTNFDLLFEACDSTLRSWKPPRLPDSQHHEDFEGIIHLHGRVGENYSGVDGDGFVLSSSEFGRAYLSDGWATQFIRSVLNRYFVVFVGYTADDPPVQYLLEALNRGLGSQDRLHAFQSGSTAEAESRWRHKGVHPIAYREGENHRAKNVEAWYESTIELARKGPEALLPHERGQVAHVVSTLEGTRRFAASAVPPPAEFWRAEVPGHELYRRLKPQLLTLAKEKSIARPHHSEILAGILLAGWGTFDDVTKSRFVTDAEMKDGLVNADDNFRLETLSQLERLSSAKEDNETSWARQLTCS